MNGNEPAPGDEKQKLISLVLKRSENLNFGTQKSKRLNCKLWNPMVIQSNHFVKL